MKISSLLEVVSAAHLTQRVDAPGHWQGRGGIMLVAPPGQFKSVITKSLDGWRPEALVLSDLTIKQLVDLRPRISAGNIRTLAFFEFPKLYARTSTTADNIEAALHQMAEDGFRLANWEDQTLTVAAAHAMIVGAMPITFYQRKWKNWLDSGFARRFLWCHFQLADPEVIIRAIRDWCPLDLGSFYYQTPQATIPFNCDKDESNFIETVLRRSNTGCEASPYILLKKIVSVLKWRYRRHGLEAAANYTRNIITDFSECIGGDVAKLAIDTIQQEPKKPSKRARA